MTENEFLKAPVNCTVFFPNIQSVSEEEYALIRRDGLGASDASVYLGLMTKFNKDTNGLIEEKLRKEISEEEKIIGKKDSVRKGKDLEDLILCKFAALHQCEKPMKPQHMYYINDFEYLTINFDGVLFENDQYVPVECKFVTTFGDKWYNRNQAYEREFPENKTAEKNTSIMYAQKDIIEMFQAKAAKYGIPAYYYVQVQQQMLGLGSSYGYLTALHDKGWELIIYRIPRDEETIRQIQIGGYKTWQKIIARKGEQ